MNIKDAYIHNGEAILKDIQVSGSKLQKLKAGKDANDAYLTWVDVLDFSSFGASGHNHDDRYLKLAGNGTTNPMTGTIYIKDVDGLIINSTNKTLNIWEVYGNSGAWASQYGFNLQYYGAGSGNDNDLILWAHAQTAATHVEVFRVHQDGSFIFKAAPKVGTNTVYHAGNLTIKTLMGTTAIGDADEPVYWSGSAFVKAGAYPTKSSWNYDDVYLKDILLDTGNATDKNKSVSLTNTNVYLKLFKTVNGAESEDSKVKIYGDTNVSVTTDSNGDIKIIGTDSVNGLTVSNITTDADISVSGVHAYQGSGGTWEGTVTSMAYAAILAFGGYSRGWQLWAQRGTGSLTWRNGTNDQTGWNEERIILDSANYTTYTVKKDGTGAGGTWGISITGNAATATTATTATNLSAKPSIQAGTSDTSKVTITAGGKTSDEYIIPAATKLYSYTIAASTDLNTIKEFKYYTSSATATCSSLVNGPEERSNGEMWFLALPAGSTNYGQQLYYSRASTNWQLWTRTWANNSFSTWVQFIHSGNIGSQSVNYATSSGKVDHKLTFTGGVTGDWDGSANKTVAIPTKSSWNYDDVYLKDVLLDTGNATDKNKSVSLTNGNVYLKLFKTVNGSEAEDSKVKIYGDTNVTVTTDSNGDIKIIGSSSVTNAEQLGGVAASSYFKNRDYAYNSEWTGKFLWTIWDNHLYAADKRFNVTVTGTTATTFGALFDGCFEGGINITESTAVIHIKHKTTDGNVWTTGLPYGNFYLVFYNSDAENVTGRVYCNYSPQGTGWHDLTVTHIGHIWILSNGYYQLSDLEITITKPASSSSITLCQVLHQVTRSSGPSLAAVMSKYCNQVTDYNITANKFIGPLQGNADSATYTFNVGSAGTAGTNYVTAAKVIATCNWYDTMTGSDTDTVINRWSEIVAFVANFTETPDLATFLSNNYLAKSGGTMTGPIKWTDNTALPEQQSPQYFVCIDAFNSGGTTKWASKANTLKALTGLTSTAIGDADEPVYWDGSKFVKAGAYPTKASWNYDDIYLKLSGGTLTGDLTIKSTSGDSPKLIFQRGTLTDSLDDWRIFDTGGNLKFQHTTGSTTTWKDYVIFSATAGTVTVNGSTVWHAGNDGSGSGLDADTVDGIHGTDFVEKRYGRFYPFIASDPVRSIWHKVTFPHTGYTSSTTAWFMLTMEIVLSGSYQNAAAGKIFLNYYFLKDSSNVWSVATVKGIAIGTHITSSGVQIRYDIANPAIFYIKVSPSSYTSFAIENLSANDTAQNFDYRTTTIEAVAAGDIPTAADKYVPIATIDSDDGNSIKIPGTFTASGGTLTDVLTLKAGTYAADNTWTYPGGSYRSVQKPNLRLIGDANYALSTIEFISQQGDTSVNKPTDCAFIQFQPHGTTTLAAIGSAPTLATSGEVNRLVIGVNNDTDDILVLQTPAANGIKHVVGTNSYQMWDSGNDGSGSGLDADLLDGFHAADFRNNIVDLRTSPQTFNPTYLKDIVFISEADYTTLVSNGTITKNSITHTYNASNWYVIEDKVPEYAENAGNADYASNAGYAGTANWANNVEWDDINNKPTWANSSLSWSDVTGKPTWVTWSETSSNATYSLSNATWTQTITLPTAAGSYILKLVSGNSTLTGVFSIGASDNAKDEISLHLHGNGPRLYARTNGTKLELSRNIATATNTSVTITYRRMI